jgi:chitinase
VKKINILFLFAIVAMLGCTKENNPGNNNNTNNNNNNNTNTTPKAKACFSFTPDQPTTGGGVTSDASCSENANFYYWTEDGNSLWYYNGNYNTHTTKTFTEHLQPGVHKITLYTWGSDSTKGTDSISKFVNVRPAVNVCFTISPNNADSRYPVNTPLDFDAGCTSGGDMQTATWNFGDANSDDFFFGTEVTHTYTNKGTFTVKLTVTDPTRTGSSTTTKVITIY